MKDILEKLTFVEKYSGDLLLLLFLLALGLMLVFLVKKKNLGSFLISSYVAYALVEKTPFAFLDDHLWKAGYFLLSTFLIFSFLKRFFYLGISGNNAAVVWIKTAIFAASISGMLASIILQWLPKEIIERFFSYVSLGLFQTDLALFLWMILPLAAGFFAGNMKRGY